MQIGITLGQRIRQAEKLPTYGNLETMKIVAQIKNKLVGFASSQLDGWRIVAVGATFVTGKPNEGTSITLEDEQVKAWGKLIRERSRRGEIEIDEVNLLSQIVNESDRIEAEEQQAQQEEEQPEGNE